jgi:hypothetical protein
VEAAADLPNIQLDLYLVRSPRTGRYLEQLKRTAGRTRNVRIVDPVPIDQIVPTMETYDVGLCSIAATNFNNLHSLPNKFFDSVQAGLAVMIGPSPDMATIVREHDLGPIAAGFDGPSQRVVLAGLEPAEVDRWRENARAARPALSAERQAEHLREVVADVLADR